MPFNSPYIIDYPKVDILSYLYPPRSEPSDMPIWIDAEDTSKSHSPKQMLQWVKKFGLGLQNLGLKKGEVVMMYSTNHIFVPVAYLGASASGCIFSGCNPAYGVKETAHQIDNAGAKVILVEPSFTKIVLDAAASTNFPRSRIFVFDDRPCASEIGLLDWHDILASDEEASSWQWNCLDAKESRTTTAILNYSSGTTGMPKGVMISHQNVVSNTAQSIYMRNLETPHQHDPSRRPSERWLGFLPLYHAYGQLWSIAAACKTLSPCYFMRAFSFPSFLRHIEAHRITHIQTAPPVLVMLAKRPETAQHDLSSLANVLCGAAPLSRELQNEVSARCGVKVVQTWGMTELTCSSMHVPGGRDDRSGSVGYPGPNCTVKLVDDGGEEVGVGERGEVLVKGPNVCMGYWRNEEATRDTFDEDGYLKTGDVAIRNKDGLYWIVDRKKELIKVKGFQVAPAELEAVLLEHEHVADAAVVAIQRDHEELARAYVVVQSSATDVSEASIVEWMKRRVAKHKQLLGGVKFVGEVPKSQSGKIQRKVLREWAARDAQEPRGPKAKL